MQDKYQIKLVNTKNQVLLDCSPNSPIATSRSDETPYNSWFFSNNSLSADRDRLFSECGGKELKITRKLHTECAIFAGNLYRILIGTHYPEYFRGEIEQYTDFQFQDPFVRVCNAIGNSKLWSECIAVDANDILIYGNRYPWGGAIPLKGLTTALVAGLFLGDIDWNPENLLVSDSFNVIKIDPGLCINNQLLDENKEDIHDKLRDLLNNYVFKIEDNLYFSEMIIAGEKSSVLDDDFEENTDSAPKLLNDSIFMLFNNEPELFVILEKIVSLSMYTLTRQAQKDFSPEYSIFAENLVKTFEKRIKRFMKAASLLEGFSDHLTRPKKYADLLEQHFFYNKPDTAREIDSDSNSNSNFYYLEDAEKNPIPDHSLRIFTMCFVALTYPKVFWGLIALETRAFHEQF